MTPTAPRLPFDTPGDLVEAAVEGPGPGSWFVARALAPPHDVFDVHAVAPGDRVLLRPQGEGRASLDAVLAAGPSRRTPPCALAARCGGCHWQQIDERTQRDLRRARVMEVLEGAGVDLAGVPLRSLPAPAPLACRARVRFQTAFGGAGESEAARRIVGFHRLGSRASLDVPECPLLTPEAARVYAVVREALRALAPAGLTGFELTALPSAPGALVYLNPRDVEPPEWPALGEALIDAADGLIAGVCVRRGAPAPDLLGARHVVGRTPAGFPVAVAARGFLQSNLAAADLLAGEVVRAASAFGGTRMLELYAGAGLLGWRLAAAGAQVDAVENDAAAIEAMAALASPPRGALRGRVADAARAFDESAPAPYDVLVADPPRAGLGPRLASAVAARGPEGVVLVSCSVAGLARDLQTLAAGYRLAALTLVDMFPQTRHTETVTTLVRRA